MPPAPTRRVPWVAGPGAAARQAGAYPPAAGARGRHHALDLELRPASPAAAGRRRLLAQGPASRSRPATTTASRSWPCAAACARGGPAGRGPRLAGPRVERRDPGPDAVGWDWIGINLFDGSALTAFQLRRADGSGAVGRRQPPRPAARCAASRRTRCASAPAAAGAARPPAPATRWTGSIETPGGPLRRARAARRAGTRQPRQHRHGLLGRPERTAGRRRRAHRPGLPGDDRLRRTHVQRARGIGRGQEDGHLRGRENRVSTSAPRSVGAVWRSSSASTRHLSAAAAHAPAPAAFAKRSTSTTSSAAPVP
jgi:hypothetical protein